MTASTGISRRLGAAALSCAAAAAPLNASTSAASDERAIAVFTMLGLFLFTAIGLAIRIVSLRRRSDLEHLNATILGLLIDAGAADLSERIRAALERLAVHAHADKAFLVLGEHPGRAYLWSRTGAYTAEYAHAVAHALRDRVEWHDQLLVAEDGLDGGFLQRDGFGELSLSSSLVAVKSLAQSPPSMLVLLSDARALRLGLETQTGLSAALAAFLQAIRRDHLERAKLDIERRLQRSRRMETIGAFASGVAHNINNIVGAIGGFAEMAEMQIDGRSRAARNLREIQTAVDRAQRLVEEMLDFGRRAEPLRRTISLSALMDESVRLLTASLPTTIHLQVEIQAENPEVCGDPGQLQQAIMNLVHNAAQAMGGHGVVLCAVAARSMTTSAPLSHAELAAGDYLTVAVCDAGKGITGGVRGRLFEPFFTTREAGTGLGLSTAWEIVLEHGGTIDVQSEPGRGSMFTIWIPAAATAASAPIPAIALGDTILIVNDDAERLERDEELIAALGYEPLGRHGWAEARPTLDQTPIVILVTDDAAVAEAAETELAGRLDRNLLLVASSAGAAVRRKTLRYPLRGSELARALAEVG